MNYQALSKEEARLCGRVITKPGIGLQALAEIKTAEGLAGMITDEF